MTVDVPFPERPPTPFWDPRGPMGMMGLGDQTPLVTGINTALNDATAAYIATQQVPLDAQGRPLIFNPTTGIWTAQATVSGSSGGMIMLLLIGAAVFFMGRR